MTIEDRDAWLDEVLRSRASGGHFKIAWIIANALMRKDSASLSLMRLEREGGEAHRRSMQRALRWLEWRGLIRIEGGEHASAPRKYTLLSRERAAA